MRNEKEIRGRITDIDEQLEEMEKEYEGKGFPSMFMYEEYVRDREILRDRKKVLLWVLNEE